MSKENIPQKVDPFRFADNGLRLKGVLPVKNMLRLCECLYGNTGEIEVDMEFGKDEQDIPFLKGKLSSVLQLQCQRCMESLLYEIANKIELRMVRTEEEAEHLPKGYDFIVVKDDILVIPEIVEDELIISLPLVPVHDLNDKKCKVTLPLTFSSEQTTEMEKENPFKIIEFLKVKRDSK